MIIQITFIVLALFGIVQGAVNEFYPKYLTAERCSGKHSWTQWFNEGKPKKRMQGDYENMRTILAKYPTKICPVPYGIQAQSINYRNEVFFTRWRRQRPSANLTLLSFSSSIPNDVDFKVRYCCPTGLFVAPETTTTPTPMPLDNATCGKQWITPRGRRMKRIVNGHYANPHSWPWMVYYRTISRRNSVHKDGACGGTIISENYVLTAAHCVVGAEPSDIHLFAGLHRLPKYLSEFERIHTGMRFFDIPPDERYIVKRHTVKQIHRHDHYDDDSVVNDIALLKVETSFVFNDYVQPVCLPGGDPEPNDQVIIVGWGREKQFGPGSDVLKEATTEVVDHCDDWWRTVDTSKQICAADAFFGSSICGGDSGGPLLTKYRGQYIVSGIASFVNNCTTIDKYDPNVFTRVSAYKGWIETIMNERQMPTGSNNQGFGT